MAGLVLDKPGHDGGGLIAASGAAPANQVREGRRQAPGRESEPPTGVLCCRGPSEGIGNAPRRSQSRSR